jgi:hypothetical protein
LIVIAIAAVVALGFSYAIRVNQMSRDSYAVWWVADMCVEHMATNNGDWPRNWDDLRDDYQACVARSGQPWSFDELSARVAIDWDADPHRLASLAANSGAMRDFRVIWLRNGSDAHWEGSEPNQIVLDYIRSQDAHGK